MSMLNDTADTIKTWLHYSTLRLDFTLSIPSPTFAADKTYAHTIIMHILFVLIGLILCLSIISGFRGWYTKVMRRRARDKKWNNRILPTLLCTKISVWLFIFLIFCVWIAILVTYIKSAYSLSKTNKMYCNTAYDVITAMYKSPDLSRSLNAVMDMVMKKTSLVSFTLNRFRDVFSGKIKKYDYAAAHVAVKTAAAYFTIRDVSYTVFFGTIFGPILISAALITTLLGAVSATSLTPLLDGLKFHFLVPAMSMWWIIAALIAPFIVGLADLCMRPLRGVIDATERKADDNINLTRYYLTCKGKNPLTEHLEKMEEIRKYVLSESEGLKMSPAEQKKLEPHLMTIDNFEKYLNPRCDWSKAAFEESTAELCTETLVFFTFTCLLAMLLAILLMILVVILYIPRTCRLDPPKKKKKKKKKKKGRRGSTDSDESDDFDAMYGPYDSFGAYGPYGTYESYGPDGIGPGGRGGPGGPKEIKYNKDGTINYGVDEYGSPRKKNEIKKNFKFKVGFDITMHRDRVKKRPLLL